MLSELDLNLKSTKPGPAIDWPPAGHSRVWSFFLSSFFLYPACFPAYDPLGSGYHLTGTL